MASKADIEEARGFLLRLERKKLYQNCRAYLAGRLRKLYPRIYQLLMKELMEDYGKDLDKKVEERLRLSYISIESLAHASRTVRNREKEYQRIRRAKKNESP